MKPPVGGGPTGLSMVMGAVGSMPRTELFSTGRGLG